jgi:putative zinc finger/helix-turn-helix YgiT family protein
MKAEKKEIKGDCFNCEKADLQPADINLTGTIKDQNFKVGMRGLRCPNCGYETIEGAATPLFRKLLSEEYKKANHLLTSAELITLRSQFEMNQEQFAVFSGVGPASLKRWELGKIQERASDDRIRQAVRARLAKIAAISFFSSANTAIINGYTVSSATFVKAFQSSPSEEVGRYIEAAAHLCPRCKQTAKIQETINEHPATTISPYLASLILGRSNLNG